MTGRLKKMLINYFQENFILYLIVIVFFIIGTSIGAILVKPLTIGQQSDLLEYVDSFINSLLNMEINSVGIFAQALFNNLKVFLYIWLLGLTVIGIPVVIGLIIARGVIMGFTVGFLVQEKGLQGVSIAIFSILPPNLLLIPAMLVAAVAAISFSIILIRGNIRNSLMRLFQHFISYSMLITAVSIFAVLAALIEAYIAPAMMKLIAVYL